MTGVEQKGGAGGGVAQHVEAVEQTGVVASNEIGRLDQVAGADGLRPEPKVRDRLGAGFVES